MQGKEIKNKHSCILVWAIVDALVLAGVVVGSWELMVAAISINVALMAGAAYITLSKADRKMHGSQGGNALDYLCYSILMLSGITSAVLTAKLYDGPRYHFKGKNETDQTMTFRDRHFIRQIVKPGESYDFYVKYGAMHRFWASDKHLNVMFTPNTGERPIEFHYAPTWTENYPVNHQPLEPKLFGTVPVGGPTFNIKAEQDRV